MLIAQTGKARYQNACLPPEQINFTIFVNLLSVLKKGDYSSVNRIKILSNQTAASKSISTALYQIPKSSSNCTLLSANHSPCVSPSDLWKHCSKICKKTKMQTFFLQAICKIHRTIKYSVAQSILSIWLELAKIFYTEISIENLWSYVLSGNGI